MVLPVILTSNYVWLLNECV